MPCQRCRVLHPARHKSQASHVPVERYTGFDSQESSPTATTQITKVSIPVGRWMKVQGKGRRQAHVISRVVMDITAFKVSHRVGSDKDTTALRAQKVERVTFHIGAMERYMWVRFAGKITVCHRHAWSRSAHQWGDGGHVREGSKCKHAHTVGAKITSKRTAVGQVSSRVSSMGQWNVTCGGSICSKGHHLPDTTHTATVNISAGRWNVMHGFDSRESSHPAREAHSKSQHSSGASGAMEETSGKVQNASTHILRGQNHEHAHSSRSVQGPVQWGDGGHV